MILSSNRILRFHSAHQHSTRIVSDFFANFPVDQRTISDLESTDSVRKSRGDVSLVKGLYSKLAKEPDVEQKKVLERTIRNELVKFPNQTHPKVLSHGADSGNVEIYSSGEARNADGRDYETIGQLLNMMRLDHLGNFTGSRSYYLMDQLAELASCLNSIRSKRWEAISISRKSR